MTREEKLMSMRSRDLVELCQKMGVKVSQSRGNLKEARAGVIQRILDAEQNGIVTASSLFEEFKNLPEDACVADILAKVGGLDAEEQAEFYRMLGNL